jgi:hypothetical protein
MEVIKSIGISNDLNRVTCGDVRIDISALHQSPSVLDYVSVIRTLSDGVGPHTLLSFARLTVPYYTVILHAINLPIRRYE